MQVKRHFEVIFLCFLAFIPPLPPGSVTKIQCSREKSRIVRKLVQSKLLPIYQKFNVAIPVECPFHHTRDLFAPQENAKVRHRPTQFTCSFCGKSFYEEKFLDQHFDNRHKKNLNFAEDAICLSNYCDIMRCDVLVTKDMSLSGISQASTDIELYNEAAALAASARKEADKTKDSKKQDFSSTLKNKLKNLIGQKSEPPQNKEKIHKRKVNLCNENSKRADTQFNKNDSKKQPNENLYENESNVSCEREQIHRSKASCKSEEISKLKSRCEKLVRTCTAASLAKLSVEEFKLFEDEMNKAVCWYLTCDRYWEDPSSQRPFPWTLLFILVVVISFGICLCYYIIWVLFDADEFANSGLINDSYNLLAPHSSKPIISMPMQFPTTAIASSIPHSISNNLPTVVQTGASELVQSLSYTQPLDQIAYSEDFFPPTAGIDEQYIYVSYPSDGIKKRTSESFYNRTSKI